MVTTHITVKLHFSANVGLESHVNDYNSPANRPKLQKEKEKGVYILTLLFLIIPFTQLPVLKGYIFQI